MKIINAYCAIIYARHQGLIQKTLKNAEIIILAGVMH
tara:strand:- start:20 stop:130 length:111 start_codon:yes stop_codon:yes gene_type:complete